MADEVATSFNSELASISLGEDEEEGDDSPDLCGGDLLERLGPGDLEHLRLSFLATADRRLSRQQFLTAVHTVLGSCAFSLPASKLFTALDVQHRGTISWGQLLESVAARVDWPGRAGDSVQPLFKVALVDPPHCKKEAIASVVPIETHLSFCYAVISKYGRTGIYNGRLQLLDTYQDASCLVVACSDRSIRTYDCSGLGHAALCHVSGLPGVPLCLEYCPGPHSVLFLGDDQGHVTAMHFHQPRASLFRKKHPDKLDHYYWQELGSQQEWVSVVVDRGVHGDEVLRMAYRPDNETLVSCSRDPATSVVVRHLHGRRLPYIFRVARGVRCFHLDHGLQLLATGSGDCLVRLWNYVVTQRPTATLRGHKDAVEDVLILPALDIVVSCAADGVVKAWHVADQCCLQTLHMNFPSLLMAGKQVEFGARSVYPGPRPVECHEEQGVSCWHRHHLLVACCHHLGVLRVAALRGQTPPPLPPPSREHLAAVPSPWKAAEDRVALTPDSSPRPSLGGVSSLGRAVHAREEPAPVGAASLDGLYARRAQHEQRLRANQYLVEQCAPHLALQLWDLQEVPGRVFREVSSSACCPTEMLQDAELMNAHQLSNLTATSVRSEVAPGISVPDSTTTSVDPVALILSGIVVTLLLLCLCCLCKFQSKHLPLATSRDMNQPTLVVTQTIIRSVSMDLPPPYTPPPEFPGVVLPWTVTKPACPDTPPPPYTLSMARSVHLVHGRTSAEQPA